MRSGIRSAERATQLSEEELDELPEPSEPPPELFSPDEEPDEDSDEDEEDDESAEPESFALRPPRP